MYQLRRLIHHSVKESSSWEEHKIIKSSAVFFLSDEEFKFLQELPREYQYHEFDNEFYIDRHPSVLEEGVDNIEFIEDYTTHLSDKFFVLYEYKEINDVI